jgi:hypothetical protein
MNNFLHSQLKNKIIVDSSHKVLYIKSIFLSVIICYSESFSSTPLILVIRQVLS